MKKIAYNLADGGTYVIVPSKKTDVEKTLGPLTDKEYEDHVRSVSIPAEAINVADIDDLDIPANREFRGAWKISGNALVEDLQESIKIKLDQVRSERDKMLSASDGEYTRALELGDDAKLAELKILRQSLRDATEPLKNGSILSVEEIRGKTLDDFLPKSI